VAKVIEMRLSSTPKPLIFLAALWLAACGPFQPAAQSTPTPLATPTADARATSDAQFNAQVIATATALHLTAIAAPSETTPEPSRPPADTAAPASTASTSTLAPSSTEPSVTIAPASQTPVAQPPTVTPLPGQPAILSFSVDRTKAQPGESVTLSWATTGGQSASLDEGICCANNGGDETMSVPANGSLVVKLEGAVARDSLNFIFEVRNASGAASVQQHVDLPCPDTYFFSLPGLALPCPASAPVYTPAAQQPFEHGLMIWLQSTGAIYVLYGNGTPKAAGQPPDGFVQYQDTWKEGDPENDPSLTPPAGLYQPVRGFGKVWRANEQNNLGWALSPEQGFQAVVQRPWVTCRHRDLSSGAIVNCSGADANHTYLQAADGRLMLLTGFLNHTPQHWEWVSTP